jgi:hypothetical protein
VGEETQVEPFDARQPDAHELVSDVFDALKTDNLPVVLEAVNSRLAAQDDHERLARLPCLRLALGQAGEPAVPGRFAALAFASLREGGRRGQSGSA